jgi:hypothetical protein
MAIGLRLKVRAWSSTTRFVRQLNPLRDDLARPQWSFVPGSRWFVSTVAQLDRKINSIDGWAGWLMDAPSGPGRGVSEVRCESTGCERSALGVE